MRRRIWSSSFLLVSLAAAALPAAAQQKDSHEVAAVRAAIDRAYATWATAAVRGDAAAIAALYTEDAIILAPNGPAGFGRAAIQAGVAAMPPIRDPRMTTIELEVLGSTAIERGAYEMTIVVPRQGPVTDRGKYLMVWKRGGDGAWRLHRESFSSDLPAPGPTPGAAAEKAAPVRAAPGDSVFVVVNYVKADMRAEWERQANDVWVATWRKLGETDPAYRAMAAGVRTLVPTRADPDGSYTYVVLIDPARPGVNYSARGTLEKLYSPEKVSELLGAWTATMARHQDAYWVVQK